MAFNGLKNRLEEIFTACIKREEKLDSEFEEFAAKLMEFEKCTVIQKRKKFKRTENEEPQITLECLHKTYIIQESVIKEAPLKAAQSYNPTPVSTKMHIKNIIKDTGNTQTKVPAKNFRRKLIDMKIPQDDSSYLCNKLPPLIPLVTTRRAIIFDDLDTDDEQAKGRFPKWSLPRYFMRRMKEQVFVDSNLVGVLFSCPRLDTASFLPIFPSTSASDLIRNDSTIWDTELF